MPAAPATVGVSARLHGALRADILEGRLAPGDAVPSERVLAEAHGASRHAVREALKRLQQAGLVQISQGGATRVLDWRDAAGLEVLLDLVAAAPEHAPPGLARAVLEMRECVAVDAARRCALRASDAERSAIAALAGDVEDAVGDATGPLVDEAYARLWRAVLDGADNVAYRLALNSLLATFTAYPALLEHVRPAPGAPLRALGDAIAAGDGARAAEVAATLLAPDAATAPDV